MILRKCLVLAIWVLAVFLGAAPALAAQDSAPGATASQAEAQALLGQMAGSLAQARQLSVKIDSGYDVVQETGEKIEFGESRKATMVRPDRIRVDLERSDGDKAMMIFDGQEITVYSPDQKMFAKASRPGDVDNAIVYLLSGLKLRMPLAMMFVTELPRALERRVRSVQKVEQTTDMGVACAHLAVRMDDVDFQVWIPTTGDPLPRRVVITYKQEPGQPQFWANLSEWNLAPNPPEGFFTFSPPEGTQRIAFLAEIKEARPNAKKVSRGGKK
jgi:hypothetical protein